MRFGKRIHHKVDQNSDEWYRLRYGVITASNFKTIMANEGKAFGDPAKKYAMRKAIERVMGLDPEEGFKSSYMERGNELEPVAIRLYEEETWNEVKPGGFWQMGIVGDSPDGIISDKLVVEVKCVKYNTHFIRLQNGGYDLTYKWQIQGHLWITGRQQCDFIQYCPEFPESTQLYICTVDRDEDMIKRLRTRIIQFNSLVESYENIAKKAA